jgi:hypothetical protein
MGMDVGEELKLTYKFEWEKKNLPPPGVEIDPGEAQWRIRIVTGSKPKPWYHVRNNGWLDWLMNNSPLRGYIYMNLMTKLD